MKRYHVAMQDDPGGFSAAALAEAVGGTVRSTVQNYNADGHDLALIDLYETSDAEELERLLDEDDNVVRYHVSEV